MGVALMSYVKHESVLRGLKDTMKCYRQLDRTEIGGKMTACFGYAVQSCWICALFKRFRSRGCEIF